MLNEALISAAAGVGAAAYAVRGKSSSLLAPSLWHGNRNRPALALTFDDGPSESTPALLELLAKNEAKATFFMCGENARRLSDIAHEVAAAGHEIGNHTDTHRPFYLQTPASVFREVAVAQESISQITNINPTLFRAPYGVRWPGLRRAQETLHLTGVMWTAIARDWKWPAPKISQLMLNKAVNGAILCFHDGRELQRAPDIRATLEAVEFLLPILKERGFSLGTVTEILR